MRRHADLRRVHLNLTGNPLEVAGHVAWGRRYQGLAALVGNRYNIIASEGVGGYVASLPLDVLNGLGVMFVLVTVWPVARRLGLAYAVFLLINILPPLAAGGLVSAGRFSSVLFPSFIWLAGAVTARHRAGWIATLAAVQALNAATGRLRFDVLAAPDRAATDAVLANLLAARTLHELNVRAGHHDLDVSPPTDARPFFFNQLRLTRLGDIATMIREWRTGGSLVHNSGLVVSGNLIAIGTLFLIILLSAVVVLSVILVPARSSVHMVDRRLALIASAYFLLIGLGFMFVEIGLIQRISLFLGHPVYALSIGLFSIILSTGLGSLLSERLTPVHSVHFLVWLGVLAAYLFLLPQWLPELTHSSLAAGTLPLRALVSVIVIFPAGLLMGFGFPTGMRLVTAIDPQPTPWLWGINGASWYCRRSRSRM